MPGCKQCISFLEVLLLQEYVMPTMYMYSRKCDPSVFQAKHENKFDQFERSFISKQLDTFSVF